MLDDKTTANAKPWIWQWLVSGLLLLATMINYMDRQTLTNLSVEITDHFKLNETQYGNLETVFGISFALGSLVFGTLADRISVRLLYPAVLVGWSAVGFITGMTQGFWSLFICRALLGFFESGHWPCALIVTQSVLSRSDRAMGNSLLQSGASLGAIITPLIIRQMVTGKTDPNAWRTPFFVIGAVGVVWVIAWLLTIRSGDLASPAERAKRLPGESSQHWLASLIVDRRFWALVMMIISINTSWQLVRAWLPKFLVIGRGYPKDEALYFNSVFYVATDVGCILAGVIVLWLARKGLRVHNSRVIVYLGCSLLAALTTLAASLPQGWPLLCVLLFVGAGLLGVFPCFYTFSQEIPKSKMGRMAGILSCVGWLASSPMHSLFGAIVDKTGSYDQGLALVGWSPLVGFVLFWLIWPKAKEEVVAESA